MDPISYGIQRSEPRRAVLVRHWLLHLACLGVFFVQLTPALLAWAVGGYVVRVFSWEAGSHRYFSHRSFKTSRAFQLFLAVLSAAAANRGPIWWAAHHRHHHRVSDTDADLHSPLVHSLEHSHIGWLFDMLDTDLDAAKDLARFPELVWVNRYHYIFPLIALVAFVLLGQFTAVFGHIGMGDSAAVWGFFVPTALSIHASLILNSVLHRRRLGPLFDRPYVTGDASVNAWWLALPTLGAAWHNNHHRCMSAARAGFRWHQLDVVYLVLRLLSALGLVWELRQVPAEVLTEPDQPTSENSRGERDGESH